MTYRWGVIGPGNIAQTFADALRHLSQGELYAIASRDPHRASQFAQKNGAEVTYDSYQALLEDPNVDIVYIATPHSHHFPVAMQALKAQKNVLIEKPFTVNSAQTRQLVSLAKANNCIFQEALWSRFMPCFATVKTWIAEGKIGALQYITSQIGFAFSGEPTHRLLNPALAGGSLLDLGIYSVSLSQFVIGQNPVSISAMASPEQGDVDHNTFVTMHYQSGVTSQFVSTIDAQCSNVMTIHGSKGFIHLPSRFWEGKQCSLWVDNECVENQQFTHQVNGFEYQIAATMALVEKARQQRVGIDTTGMTKNLTTKNENAKNKIDISALCDPRMNHADSIAVMETLDSIRDIIKLRYGDDIEAL